MLASGSKQDWKIERTDSKNAGVSRNGHAELSAGRTLECDLGLELTGLSLWCCVSNGSEEGTEGCEGEELHFECCFEELYLVN
jgi:hypothetical protein